MILVDAPTVPEYLSTILNLARSAAVVLAYPCTPSAARNKALKVHRAVTRDTPKSDIGVMVQNQRPSFLCMLQARAEGLPGQAWIF